MKLSSVILRSTLGLALLFASSARANAENWKVLFWDPTVLVLVGPAEQATTPDHQLFRLLQVRRYPGTEAADAASKLSQEEVDCSEQRLRSRSSRQFFQGQATAERTEIAPWREGRDEMDRLFVQAFCLNKSLMPALPTLSIGGVDDAVPAHNLLADEGAEQLKAKLPKWAPSLAAVEIKSKSPGADLIHVAALGTYEFAVLSVREGDVRLIPLELLSKAGEGRYRLHEVIIHSAKGDKPERAQWALREFDCDRQAARNISWGGYDAAGKPLYGHQTHLLAPFDLVAADTSSGVLLQWVCDRASLEWSIKVTSNLAQAIDAYDRFYDPAPSRTKAPSTASPWSQAYRKMCGPLGCLPKAPHKIS